MNLIKNYLYSIVILCAFTACSNDILGEEDTSSTLETSSEVVNNTVFANELLEVLNEYRASIGLNSLSQHDESEELAVKHSYYMVQQNEASHDNFYDRAQILQESGANYVSENVAFGYYDAASVLQGWLDSPSHKSAIEGNYTHSGIGIVHTDNGVPYFTQLFIR
ncbi:CAP domain-containing protein [Dokdonia sp. Hel_I_53]|uniref:CAP domain-containing protein n=1 Tax=Dokdonia sp. Hel_I_53 TaxID=1566287 RepID=UPI001644D700|nr:CAP domain-containing protein [Dokdonia sp. Hel_I_53]